MNAAPVPVSRKRRTARFLASLVPLILLALLAVLVHGVLNVDPRGCQDPNGAVLPATWLIVLGVAGLVAGRLLGRVRYRDTWLEVNPAEARTSELAGILAFMGLLLATAVILVYEAIGVQLANQKIPSPEPITYYVRCAAYADLTSSSHGAWTALVVLMVRMLAGHWLWSWHPPEQRPATRDASGAPDRRA